MDRWFSICIFENRNERLLSSGPGVERESMTAKQTELWAPSPGKSGPICFPGLNLFTHSREMCFCKFLFFLFFFFAFLFFSFIFILKYKCVSFNWRLITLQYCIGFAIHLHESATGIYMFPILNPPPSSLPVPSFWVVSVHQPQASSIMHRTWTGDS